MAEAITQSALGLPFYCPFVMLQSSGGLFIRVPIVILAVDSELLQLFFVWEIVVCTWFHVVG